jgi:hypothetical protein
VCKHKKDSEPPKIITEHIHFSKEVDEVTPPPPGLTSNFRSVQEWLFNICNTEKPGKLIATYNFGVFESQDDYTIFLVGLNEYGTEQHSITRIDFEPSSMYFRLPKNEYKDLNREQVLARLTSQLKDFTTTEKFRTSFFMQAQSITTDFKGEIWSK